MMVSSMRHLALAALALIGLPAIASAQDMQAGSVTGLPVPRYVSLKTDRVNLREGPSKEHRTRWVYQRAGLPMEVTAVVANHPRSTYAHVEFTDTSFHYLPTDKTTKAEQEAKAA